MGNHFACNNYYCGDITFKPEWFSENSWKIEYNIEHKPYIIDKGLLKISNTSMFHLLLTKKLLIDFKETRIKSPRICPRYFCLFGDILSVEKTSVWYVRISACPNRFFRKFPNVSSIIRGAFSDNDKCSPAAI